MAPLSLALRLAMALLMVDSIIELSFISSMVAWLHFTASGVFPVAPTAASPDDAVFDLAGKPLHFSLDQGHTSNGAAGTAFVLIGLGGILALLLRSRRGYHGSWISKALYRFWVAAHVPALLLTFGALAYVFAVTNAHEGQVIDVAVASGLDGAPYPLDTWTPQNWFAAVLQLPIADSGVRADIESHYRVMRGWQYNLIPMAVIQFAETVFAIAEAVRRRREGEYSHVDQSGAPKAWRVVSH